MNSAKVSGTSDVIESQYHRRLLKRALQYATEYNVELHFSTEQNLRLIALVQ